MIITVTDFDIPFVYLTVNAAMKELAHNLNMPCITYRKQDFFTRNIPQYGEACIFIIEAAYLEHGRFSVGEVKKFYPKSKVVVLGSDTFYHIYRGTRQFQGLEETDLFLDLMGECAVEYSKYTITDTWCWSSTKSLNDYLLQFAKDNSHIKPEIDFISVLGKHTLSREGSYRKAMVEYIRASGTTFTRGDSDGYQDKDMDKLYRSYLKSSITIGTTSHDNGMRSAKGFRDTVGIMLGRPLIYDDHPDTNRDFNCAPKYDFNNFNSLMAVGLRILDDKTMYDNYVYWQRQWAEDNTIELQLEGLFEKHGII